MSWLGPHREAARQRYTTCKLRRIDLNHIKAHRPRQSFRWAVKCCRCNEPMSVPAAEYEAPCGCCVIVCSGCAVRDDMQWWATRYAGLHRGTPAGTYVVDGQPSSCPRCVCNEETRQGYTAADARFVKGTRP